MTAVERLTNCLAQTYKDRDGEFAEVFAADLRTLLADLERMKAALEPFAEQARHIGKDEHLRVWLEGIPIEHDYTPDFRAARLALRQHEDGR